MNKIIKKNEEKGGAHEIKINTSLKEEEKEKSMQESVGPQCYGHGLLITAYFLISLKSRFRLKGGVLFELAISKSRSATAFKSNYQEETRHMSGSEPIWPTRAAF